MKTFSLRKEDVARRWVVVVAAEGEADAQGVRGPHASARGTAARAARPRGGLMGESLTPELRWHAVGRRKVSVARVYLTPGSGKWNINKRTLGDYFPRPSLVSHTSELQSLTNLVCRLLLEKKKKNNM